jgi:hypothetical protein
MQQVGEGWQVGWFEYTLTNPTFFAHERDAAAFLLGKVALDDERAPAPSESTPAASEPEHEDPVPAAAVRPAAEKPAAGPAGPEPASEPEPVDMSEPAEGKPLARHE